MHNDHVYLGNRHDVARSCTAGYVQQQRLQTSRAYPGGLNQAGCSITFHHVLTIAALADQCGSAFVLHGYNYPYNTVTLPFPCP